MNSSKPLKEHQESIQEFMDVFIDILKATSHPNRLKILNFLLTGPKSFQEIFDVMDLANSALANHLKKLLNVKLIEKVQHGRYRITPDGNDLLLTIDTIFKKSRYFKDKAESIIREESKPEEYSKDPKKLSQMKKWIALHRQESNDSD